MFHKYLFVGLGGSGGKTLRFLKRDIERWLERNGQSNQIPAGWKFLHIDTPTNPDGNELNHLVPQIGKEEYLGLIDFGIDMHAVQSNLDSKPNLHDELMSWRIAPANLGVPLSLGAGQFRAIGRTVAVWTADRINQAIKSALSDLESANVDSELKELYNNVTGESAQGTARTHIIIVSSLAGGTGAGLMQDVCDIIRAMDKSYSNEIFAVLYAAEAFDSLGGDGTSGVQPNTLAAFSELMNGHWYNGDEDASEMHPVNPPISDSVLQAAGLPVRILRSGPNYPFLVGRKGAGGIDYATPTKLFEMIGRSLLSWLTSPTVADEFLQYTITNWDNAAAGRDMQDSTDLLVNQGIKTEHGLPAISGLGFGRLSVGTEYFEEYSIQRIVRSAHSQAKDYNDTSSEAKDIKERLGTNDPNEVAVEIARQNIQLFLQKAKLDELGPESNDIIDQLIPANLRELNAELNKTVRNLSKVDEQGKEQPAADWCSAIINGVTVAKQPYRAGYQEGLNERSAQWVQDIEQNIVETIEWFISRIGLAAAGKLCSLVAEKLTTEINPDLVNEASQNFDWSEGSSGNAACDYGLQNLRGQQGKMSSDSELLQSSVGDTVRNSQYYGEYLRKIRAAELCNELASKVLAPIASSLNNACDTALSDWNEATSEETPIAMFIPWNDETPPDSVRPPAGEFTLIEPDSYPELFIDLLRNQTNEVQEDDIQISTQRATLCSDWIREQEDITSPEIRELLTISISSSWKPLADWVGEPPKNIKVEVQTDKESLIRRARYWLRKPGTPTGVFLSTSLRSYLGDDELLAAEQIPDAEKARRLSKFMGLFNAALDSSAPLINIDNACLSNVHNVSGQGGLNLDRVFSEIPLDSHPAGEAIKAELASRGISGSKFNIDGEIDHIDITTAIGAPVSPLVVDSIWQPIAQSYQKAGLGSGMGSFWLRRRSRTFQRFVPAPQQTIIAMIRGWVAARFLGILSESQIKPDSGQLSIGMEGNKADALFPHPLLTEVWDRMDELPAVLESLGLAYMHVNTLNNLEPLAPYIRLRDLGRAEGQPDLYSYNKLSKDLRIWVDTGQYPSEAITKPGLTLEGEVDGPEQRLTSLLKLLDGWERGYDDSYARYRERLAAAPAALTAPPHFPGLIKLIDLALDQMLAAARNHVQVGSSSGEIG